MKPAYSVLILALFTSLVAAQQPPAPVDPQPPRITDLPARPAASAPRRTATPSPTPTAAPAPTLEQSLTPDLKAPPADPKQRALDNLNRTLQQQRSKAAAEKPNTNGAPRVDRVEVEGLRPDQRDPVKEAFDRNLPPPKRSGIEEVVLDNGARCVIDHDCVGPACGRPCTAGNGTRGNQNPGGISIR